MKPDRGWSILKLSALVGLVLGALVIAGCGSSDSSSTSSGGSSSTESTTPSGGSGEVAAAAKATEENEAPVTEWSGPTEAFEPPTGKKVTLLECGAAGAGCKINAEAAAAAGKVLGWQTKIVDGKFEPSVWNTAVRQAASEGQDGIVLLSVSPALVREGLELAKKNGLEVIVSYQEPEPENPKVNGYVFPEPKETAAMLANLAISSSEGKGNILYLESPEYPNITRQNEAFVSEIEENCPECQLTKATISAATMAEKLPSQIASQLQSNPDINYIQSPYDPAAEFIAQGIRQAGKSDSVKLLGVNGQPAGLELLAQGEQYSDLATSSAYMGWLDMDQMARAFAGDPSQQESNVPQRMFTENNIDEIEAGTEWNLDFDYVNKFEELWGK